MCKLTGDRYIYIKIPALSVRKNQAPPRPLVAAAAEGYDPRMGRQGEPGGICPRRRPVSQAAARGSLLVIMLNESIGFAELISFLSIFFLLSICFSVHCSCALALRGMKGRQGEYRRIKRQNSTEDE